MNNLKILLYDIETSYILARLWNTGKQWVGPEQIVVGKEQNIICISYKWLGEKQIYTLHWGIHKQDSTKMIEAFSKVVAQADLCLGHNADKFDSRHINTQRWLKNQDPIAWPSTEDTLKQLKKHFYLPSYKLDYIAKILLGKGKSKMVFDDWVQVVEGKSKEHFDKMIKYCERDVKLLEGVYKRSSKYFRPKIHAGLAKGNGKLSCPNCGTKDIRAHGTVITLAGRMQRWQCSGGHIFKFGKV